MALDCDAGISRQAAFALVLAAAARHRIVVHQSQVLLVYPELITAIILARQNHLAGRQILLLLSQQYWCVLGINAAP